MGSETTAPRTGDRLDWIEPLKALALFGILLNHFVECFGPGPWFANPSHDWPDLATRLKQVYPGNHPFPISAIQFLGWLGDIAPGVFILLSGLGLTLGRERQHPNPGSLRDFYGRRLSRLYSLYMPMHFVILALAILVPAGKSARTDYGDRRDHVMPTLVRHFTIQKVRKVPRLGSSIISLYTGLRLHPIR